MVDPLMPLVVAKGALKYVSVEQGLLPFDFGVVMP